jgi:hypothetical protein
MLQTQTVEPLTLGLLRKLMLDPLLGQFVLVGGTALSLQIGHRKSVDLDMFTSLDFQASEILEHLDENGYQPLVLFNQKQTLILSGSSTRLRSQLLSRMEYALQISEILPV